MRSLGKGVMSATTQVKVLSLEILYSAMGQGFDFPEASIGMRAQGECITGVPGSKSVAGKRTVYIGTWENRSVPTRSFQEAEEVTRKYVVSVVGLIHSRGVGRVMPVGSVSCRTLEGISSQTQRDEACHAAP
jgi:hypothetical protein